MLTSRCAAKIGIVLLVAFILLSWAGSLWAGEDGESSGPPASGHEVKSSETSATSAEGEPAAGAAHGEEDHSVLGLLTHHLMDSPQYQFLFWKFDLPVLHLGSFSLPITKHTIMLITAAVLLFILLLPLGRHKGIVPHGFANFFEVIIVFIRDEVVYPSLGEEDGRKFLPFFLTAFFFVLFSNLLGMIPYGSTPTGNISVTGSLAVISLLVMLGAGVVKHGPLGFLGSFVPHGVPVFVIPILFPIEITGVLVKHFALCIRLFANMLAGHAVITVFLALISSLFIAPISIVGAVAISMLELFVAFLQAYIFTMLSSLFIGSALHPAH